MNNICQDGVEKHRIYENHFLQCRYSINFQYRVRVHDSTLNSVFNEASFCCAYYERIKDTKFVGYSFCKESV